LITTRSSLVVLRAIQVPCVSLTSRPLNTGDMLEAGETERLLSTLYGVRVRNESFSAVYPCCLHISSDPLVVRRSLSGTSTRAAMRSSRGVRLSGLMVNWSGVLFPEEPHPLLALHANSCEDGEEVRSAPFVCGELLVLRAARLLGS
jgi:hypothetical protein